MDLEKGVSPGMGSPVTRDLPPFTKAYGSPVRIQSLNVVALQRLGASAAAIEQLEAAYHAGDVGLESVDFSMWDDALVQGLTRWKEHVDLRPTKWASKN